MKKQVELSITHNGKDVVAYPYSKKEHVQFENGMNIDEFVGQDIATPTITHDTTAIKVGIGDSDVSGSVVDGTVNMTIKGQTYQNILPEPTLRNEMQGKSMQRLNEGYDNIEVVDGVSKSAILSGNTGYRDIDTGEFLETFEEGRNLELVSVKMPVLTTTTSQNLSSIPFSFFEKTTDRKYGAWTIFEFDNLFSGKIIINKRPFNTIMYFDTKENRLDIGTTVVKDVQFIAFYNPSTNIENNNKGNLLELLKSGELDLSLQENGKMNVYSYKKNDKTNILTCNEDLELCGIGDVKDELNVMTGEYIKRIGELVLDGSEGWGLSGFTNDNYFVAYCQATTNSAKADSKIKCDKIPYDGRVSVVDAVCEGINIIGDKSLRISMSKNRVSNLSDFISWLQSNPTTIQYELAEPTIKTVDLLSSGNWEKVVYSGASNESWSYRQEYDTTNTYCFKNNRTLTNALLVNQTCPSFSDNLPINGLNTDKHSLHINGQPNIIMKIDKKLINEPTDINLRQYLQQNPITVWYQTATHQDNSIREMLSFANGHLQVSSEAENSLLPSVQYEIPTKNSYHMDLMKANTTYTMKLASGNGSINKWDGEAIGFMLSRTFNSGTLPKDNLFYTTGWVNDLMILEGDLNAKTIPYFKGIKSAFEDENKIEVLSTGKNLFDINYFYKEFSKLTGRQVRLVKDSIIMEGVGNTKHDRVIGNIKLKPNTAYKMSCNIKTTGDSPLATYEVYYNDALNRSVYLTQNSQNGEFRRFTAESSGIIQVRLDCPSSNNVTEYSNIYIVEDDGGYEPHKSNNTKIPLLSPLRSLPNGVCDELVIDRLNHKAKLIQRVGELVLNGNEEWTQSQIRDKHYIVMLRHCSEVGIPEKYPSTLLCSRFINQQPYGYDREGINVHTNYNFHIGFLKNRLLDASVNSCKKWLSQNPTTVLYELNTPIITEIDLEGYPYAYKDGHIFLNSDIAPTTQITYSINQAQQIESANENLQRHEKEISHLQKLIAQYIQVEYVSTLLSLKL